MNDVLPQPPAINQSYHLLTPLIDFHLHIPITHRDEQQHSSVKDAFVLTQSNGVADNTEDWEKSLGSLAKDHISVPHQGECCCLDSNAP